MLPPVMAAWLIGLGPPGMIDAELGGRWTGWLFRGSLVLVSSVLFWPVAWLSGRYVSSARLLTDGRMSFTLWGLLGPSDHLWPGFLEGVPVIDDGRGKGSGVSPKIRMLFQPMLRALFGYRARLWPGGPTLHEGRTHIPGRVWVDAPFVILKPARGRLLLIDMQGEFPAGFDAFLDAL